jgi:mannose-6-phosphate isomerase-like protein (cupin superfamily)
LSSVTLRARYRRGVINLACPHVLPEFEDWTTIGASYTLIVIAHLLMYVPAMQSIDRRTLLGAFGIASVGALLPAQAALTGKVVVTNPGENRFPFVSAEQAKRTVCKVTSEDSAGLCTVFELNVFPRSGPSLHVHHREDEWYYVLSGEFLFKVGGVEHSLPVGASIWAPRGIPHVWANTGTTEGKLILTCLPGGLEKFFDELGKVPMDHMSLESMKGIMSKYGMELLGPPLLSWAQQH